MIDVYGMSSPNVLKVTIALEEMGLPYRQHYVNMITREQYAPAFLAISPLAKVPAIVDQHGADGRPQSVFESGAILLYLAEKTGALLPAAGAPRAAALEWLMVQLTTVGPMFGQLVHFLRAAPAGNEYGLQRYTSQVKRVLEALERRLSGATFLAGDEYTIADVATWPWLRTAQTIFPFLGAGAGAGAGTAGAGLKDHPGLQRWYEAVGARPGVVRGVQAGERFLEEDKQAFAKADAEALDRFFERGKWAR